MQDESYSAGSCPGCARWWSLMEISEGNVTLGLALPWVREAKPAGTLSPHRTTANPAGQAPSELRADTCRAGLCPPEVANICFRVPGCKRGSWHGHGISGAPSILNLQFT
ncbi:UNVERIFIED_CONTAM: hypothetical protein FKN15_002025 [Acipenser sinensis]